MQRIPNNNLILTIMKAKTETRAKSAKKVNAKKVNNSAKCTVEVIPAIEVQDNAQALPVAAGTTSGKVSTKEVLKAAGSLRKYVKEERRGANCTIRLIAERAASGDAAAVDVLCALCDVPRAALFSLNIDIIRAAVNSYYPYYVETEGRKVSVKPAGVWYSTAASDEAIEAAAKRVRRGYIVRPVADYLDQLIKAAKCRAKGVQPRRVEAEAIYNNIELSEATEGVTAAEISEAKKRKVYLSGAVNVWKNDRTGFYI